MSPQENRPDTCLAHRLPQFRCQPGVFSGIRLASVRVNPILRRTAAWGDDVRALFRNAAMFAVAAMLWPEFGVAQQPRVVSVAGNAPHTQSWMARASGNPQMPARPGPQRAAIERPVKAPGKIMLEPLGKSENSNSEDAKSQSVVDVAAMLRPTWDRGFWFLPPGGLTRFLIPSRAIINVDEAPVDGTRLFVALPGYAYSTSNSNGSDSNKRNVLKRRSDGNSPDRPR